MAAPYDYGNSHSGYHNLDHRGRAPSPYHHQNTSSDYYNQHPQQFEPNVEHSQPSPYSEGPTPAIDGVEGDRGILGALGGGVTGGYVGKQTCHGFLGTVGGAIVGSLTEDWAKKKKNSSRPCSPQPPPCGPPTTIYPPACVPNNGHPGPIHSPSLVHAQTNTTTHIDVQPGQFHYPHQTHYPTHPAPQGYGHPHPAPQPKPCGHQHTCACKWFGKH